MKRYSIIHIPVWSFFSQALYRDIALQWKGTCFGYLFLLLAVAWIPAMIVLHQSFSAFVADEAPKLTAQLPHLTILDGEASITEPEPFFFENPDTGMPLAIIDTTGSITSLDDTPAKLLITRTEAIFETNESETETISFSEIDDFKIGPEQADQWLKTLNRVAAPVLYPLAVLGSYAYRIVQALIYAVVGLLFASLFHARIGYAALLRLSVAAVTPCIIVNTVLGVQGVALPFAPLWYFLATMGYLLFAVSAVSQAEDVTPVMEEQDNTAWPGDQ